jgi:nucleotide-binding universal stress UspA family protein
MFKHILVPLDGSELAEDALPPVVALAQRLGARVTLLHVLERDAPTRVHGERHVTTGAEGAGYIGAVADRLKETGLDVDVHIHDRQVTDVAVAIDSHAHEYSVDLIAMCKHGDSGLRQRLLGGIAQQILQRGSTPILLRSPREHSEPSTFELGDILVPLDLEHDAGTTLRVAADLARAFSARVHLITAVPTLAEARRSSAPARLLPSATEESLRIEEEEAHQELRRRGDELARSGIEVRVGVHHEEAPAAIVREAEEIPADLVVLGTHARAGFDAWFAGSTGHRVISGTTQTLLLIREL